MTEKENVFVHAMPTNSDERFGSSSIEREQDIKGPTTYATETSDFEAGSDVAHADPFEPFDDLDDERKNIVTIRAVLLGCVCGALVGSSNIYLGLKTGWTFTASLFGAIIGFAVIKPLSKALPETFPILGGSFGELEGPQATDRLFLLTSWSYGCNTCTAQLADLLQARARTTSYKQSPLHQAD